MDESLLLIMAVFIFLCFSIFDYKFIYEVIKKVYTPQKQRSKINQYLTKILSQEMIQGGNFVSVWTTYVC